ncbi:hypothetical protein AXF19_05595 [Selenomonas sp. oral taxon 126]|uniref:tetratricopeptide repeat protein n=1 Tax=Selenomonas sp. oral taxon 126 TaxID=712528 RepID=UPI000807798C|nr:tetratricopeptide repeat protein [Selenomonas sp. oral taxon 126]ANR70498.1 hypothetical protein AXF19_05595 [Selenomonas sp. oral taxon 126]
MKKRKKNRAERARKKRARREEKRNAKGTMTMAEKKMATVEQIRAHMEKKAYAEVINTFADMLEQGHAPEECFGDVARAYFELGDYTRAASWVTNTLSRDASNVDVRILLARICQREKRPDDALKLFENILSVHKRSLSYEQRTEIGRLAGLDARLNPARTRTEYPQLAALLGLAAPTEAAAPAAAAPAAPAVVSAVPTPAPVQATSSPAAAEQQAAAILAQEIRPVEKVETLNAFAGAAYASNDYSGAKTLLMAALRLDPGCDATLRNMALLLHEMGERDKALQVAAKMRMADFMLLRELKR